MRRICLLAWLGMVPVWAGEMPEKAAGYHAALVKRPESAQLFERFRDAWLEERSTEDLEKELLARAEAREAGAWATLGRAYLAAGRTEKALEAFDKAREQSPAAWLNLETAGLRLAAKDFAAAEKDALAVPEGDPRRLDALKLAGLACLRAERIDDALAYWTQAVAAAPGDTGLLEDLTELTRREGRFDLALDYCGKWRDATSDAYGKAMATLRRSELLLGSQRFDEAMTELAAVLAVSADDSWLERETLARAEQAHRLRGNATGWAAWIGAKADEFPARLNFRRTQALALAAAGKTDGALEVLTEVMRRSPGDNAARWQRIGLLERAMKLGQAYDECVELAAKEKSETAGLRLAELAFRLEKKDELKRALDGVLAAADPAKRVGLAGLYARYGLPESSERIWREAAGGEQGGQALRQLAKHLRTAGRERDAIDVWKQLGAREVALDRIEAAQMLSAADERGVAREILTSGREKFSAEPGYEAALADLAMVDGKPDEARAIYLKLVRASKQPDELTAASKGWLRSVAALPDPLQDLGEETPDRCLRAAWLAAAGKPLPAIRNGDELERAVRQTLLREQGRWAEVVVMMEAVPGEHGPLLLSELAEAKTAAGDLPGALAAAQAWRSRVPDQAGPWLFEAGTLEKLGKQADATVLLRRAAARFEDNEDVAKRLFAILRESLDPRESLQWAWKRHDRSPDEAVRSSWLREILLVSKERDQLADLKERFEERARRDPASPGPLVALAELAKASGDSQAELDLLRRAAVNAPRDLAVISALAALEERSGEAARALERYAALARLAPGPDSARNLAQAKIRLGDIEGGMRDLQALAGEKGLDLRALEQSAGDLASRGYLEEATRLLMAVDPAQRTARLDFVLGMLLDIDGRESEAVDAFIKVMAEPDDPAENRQRVVHGDDGRLRTRQYSQIIQSYGGRHERIPGVFTGFQVPQSLVDAKMIVKSQLSRLAMQRGGEIWTKAATIVPELAAATPEQWREAMDFSQTSENGQRASWWDFVQDHPGNPLGVELLVEGHQHTNGTPEQVDALLKTHLPLRTQMLLRFGQGEWRADNLEFLESLDPVAWQDETVRAHALRMVQRMIILATSESAATPVTASECSRGLALLENAGLGDAEAGHLELLRARLALLKDDPEQFVTSINGWMAVSRKLTRLHEYAGSRVPVDTFEHWQKKAGHKKAEALIARIESPLLRCQLSLDSKPEQRIDRVNRELAALPKDVPAEIRRGLIQWKWSLYQRGELKSEAFLKEIKATMDDPDPLLAFQASFQLMSTGRNNGELSAADRLKLQELVAKLAASPDAGDQAIAAQYGSYFGRASRSPRMQTPVVATRWGTSASFSSGNSSRNRLALPAILSMGDKVQAIREAAKFLEIAARAAAGQTGNLSEPIKALSDAGLLEGALARISLPPDAGLGRRVALITLMDASSQADRARGLLEDIAKSRPWETRWTVDLALRSPEDAEMRRLLDSVAERGDFDRIMGELLVTQNRGIPGAFLARLAEWAPEAKGRRGWVEQAMSILAQSLTKKDDAQPATFQRYVKLALDDRRLGELGFRMMLAPGRVETPDAITDAARRALLSGAYTSAERTFSSTPPQGPMAVAALEHLVLLAEKSGDDTAFPADFRENLKAVDPDSETWIAKMLAAKTVAELPDVSNTQARSSSWVALARHEAAMLRAVKMPGRDAWLTGVFRENKYQSMSENLQHVLRASLLEAGKARKLPDRVFAWLEAAAGPRKSWSKDPKRTIAEIDPFAENSQPNNQLSQAATFILTSAGNTEATTLLAVLDLLREARVPVSDANSVFSRLGQSWRQENQPPRSATTLAELLGNKREAAYTLGVWQSTDGSGGKLRFIWGLPQLVQIAQQSRREEMTKAVKDNPDAGFLDLFQAWLGTSDKALQRRVLLKAAPDLAKLPPEIRGAVTDVLTQAMGPADMKGLPDFAVTRLRETLDAASKLRIKSARQTYEGLKSKPSADRSYLIGSMLGPVIGDDEAFVAEVLADWRPLADADKSGKEIEAFMGGIISNSGSGPEMTMTILRLLDSLSKDLPLPLQRNSKWGDPMENLWGRLRPQTLSDPEFWREAAALSPRLQAQFWLRGPRYAENGNFTADPKLVELLRVAAKGGEVTRTALEWCLQCAAMRYDEDSKIDGAALFHFAVALKAAGSSTDAIAALICRGYLRLPRLENPGLLMAETPTLLAGLKSFPVDEGGKVFQGVQSLWEEVQRERRKAGGNDSETVLSASVYPVETAALLKFALTRASDPSRINSYGRGLTPIVIATGDGELLDLWIKFGGKSLVGDLALIIVLLEKDRVTEAVALAPPASRGFSSHRQFSSHLESLVAKLNSVATPQSFGLLARLSLLSDATGDEAPAEKFAARRARLADEFERVRGGMSASDRAAICLALGLNRVVHQKHVPALDEFASEEAAQEFKKLLLVGNESAVAQLFVPAACSRVYQGDLSGISLLAAAIASSPTGPRGETTNLQFHILTVHASLADYASRLDAKLPDASVEIILTYAKALAGRMKPMEQGIASHLVHLAATDAASLLAGLERCGLEGVKPAMSRMGGRAAPDTLQVMMRVAVLHPVASEALLESLGNPTSMDPTSSPVLPLLHEPGLRARISPDLFLKWNRHLMGVDQKNLEMMKLYAAERRGDFDETQRIQLDAIIQRMDRPDPTRLNEMRRQQRGQQMREEMEARHRMMLEQSRGQQPR